MGVGGGGRLLSLCFRVQQGDSRRDEAVPEPAGPGTEDPVTPPRREEANSLWLG